MFSPFITISASSSLKLVCAFCAAPLTRVWYVRLMFLNNSSHPPVSGSINKPNLLNSSRIGSSKAELFATKISKCGITIHYVFVLNLKKIFVAFVFAFIFFHEFFWTIPESIHSSFFCQPASNCKDLDAYFLTAIKNFAFSSFSVASFWVALTSKTANFCINDSSVFYCLICFASAAFRLSVIISHYARILTIAFFCCIFGLITIVFEFLPWHDKFSFAVKNYYSSTSPIARSVFCYLHFSFIKL